MGPRVGRCGLRVDAQALPGTRRHVARFALHATRRHRGPRHARTTRASPVPPRDLVPRAFRADGTRCRLRRRPATRARQRDRRCLHHARRTSAPAVGGRRHSGRVLRTEASLAGGRAIDSGVNVRGRPAPALRRTRDVHDRPPRAAWRRSPRRVLDERVVRAGAGDEGQRGARERWRALRAAQPVRRRARSEHTGASVLWRRPRLTRSARRGPRRQAAGGRAPAGRASVRRRELLRAAAATALAACVPTTTAPSGSGDLVGTMSLERKVGQLMSVAFHGTKITSSLEAMIRDRGIGGVILYSENFSDAASLAKLLADLDRIAREARSLPLFFEIDQEGGPVIRINKGATVLPGQMALAATADPERNVRTAAAISAAELRAIGVNWTFAPVADVNDEPTNPIIGNRSFSSDPARVSSLVTAAVQTYAAAGFFCCAKHFPGHGSTTTDSHTGLPKIEADRATLDRVELPPLRAAIAAGVPAIMSAHIVVPALDPTPELPVALEDGH